MKKFVLILAIGLGLSGPLAAEATRSMELSWMIVSDLEQAIEFYTKVVGLKADEVYPEMGWAELVGTGGARLGLVQAQTGMQPGVNAVITITVDDIVATSEEFAKKGAKRLGDIEEVPNMCKLQLFVDSDGNQFQLHQPLA